MQAGSDARNPREQVEAWRASEVLGWNRYTVMTAHIPLTIKLKWLSLGSVGKGGTLCLQWEGLRSHVARGVDIGSQAGVVPVVYSATEPHQDSSKFCGLGTLPTHFKILSMIWR